MMHPHDPRQSVRSFTLIELMVVVALIAIALGIAFPMIAKFVTQGTASSSTTLVSAAVSAARAYSTQQKAFGGTTVPFDDGFAGAAMIFTPQGEIRLVQNVEFIKDAGGAWLEANNRNGYTDIPEQEYITIPENVGVMGITRGGQFGGNATLYFLPPPFAVRFDSAGKIVVGAPDPGGSTSDTEAKRRFVMYDWDNDAEVAVGSIRTSPGNADSPYSPEAWDPGSNVASDPNLEQDDQGRWSMPFDRIEVVAGILLYNKDQLQSQLGASTMAALYAIEDDQTPTGVVEWLMTSPNVKQMFFSPYTGVSLQELNTR